MLAAVTTLVTLGALFGVGLYVSSHFFSVEIDPQAERIADILPGANCGGCAFGGCAAFAKAVAAGAADVSLCAPGGDETAKSIAEIMGVDFSSEGQKVSMLLCAGDSEKCPSMARYEGIGGCVSATLIHSAAKGCSYGCTGLGTCVRACPFDAIVMNDKGLPYVLEERCTACGLCVDACPKDLFEMRPASAPVHVRCSSRDKGPVTRKLCAVGCTGCGLCVKACKFEAIEVVDNLAVIDYEKCKGCDSCAEACPQDTIWSYRKVRKERKKAAVAVAAAA